MKTFRSHVYRSACLCRFSALVLISQLIRDEFRFFPQLSVLSPIRHIRKDNGLAPHSDKFPWTPVATLAIRFDLWDMHFTATLKNCKYLEGAQETSSY